MTTTTTMIGRRSYSELIEIPSFQERFEYLQLDGRVGEATFGSSRILNQSFYRSKEWRRFRDEIIVRDNGRDLAHPDHDLCGSCLVHHINPLTIDDVRTGRGILDPENVILVGINTHKAIHFANYDLINTEFVERFQNDTCPWRR